MEEKCKKKILIIHNYYQIPGGEDTVVANEKKLLEDHGHQVVLYSRNNSELKSFSRFQKLCLPFTTIFSFKTYKDVKKIIRDQHIDIVHVHNTISLISPSVYYAAFSCKVPVVQTIHNFRLLCPGATFYRDGHICEDCVNQGLKCAVKHKCYRKSKLQTLMCVIILKIHRCIGTYKKLNYICLTEFNKEKLMPIIKTSKIYVKPNFTFDAGGPVASENYYIFIGRLEEIKGIDLLIDVFKILKNCKLVILGSGVLDYKIKKRLKDENMDNVQLLGYIPPKEVSNLLSKAKALIVCSLCYETFGMVIIEAYSNGIPVIAGNIGNIGDLVIDGKTGLKFVYNSVDSLVQIIKKFNNYHIDEINEMKKNAYFVYTKNYSAEANYIKLIKIYNQIAKCR